MSSLLLVEWDDSSAMGGWHEIDSRARITKCISVGLLVHEDDKQIVLVSSRSDFGNVADSNAIPKCSIKKIWKLKVGGINGYFRNLYQDVREGKRDTERTYPCQW